MTPARYALFVALVVTGMDRLAKSICLMMMAPGQSIKVIPGVFHLTFIFNSGAAFGLFKGHGSLFVLAAIISIAAIFIYLLRQKGVSGGYSLALGLILGGAFGNLIDRLFLGAVIDFLDFRVWPVFNVADSCITIGVFILIYNMVRFRKVT